MESPAAEVAARVRAQYEAFPYPAYGLFLPLRGQEAYASHSLFAARLLEQRGRSPALRRAARPAVLLAGCGDVFPYLATFWEPRSHRLIAADLSARSLRRARLRCLPRLRAMEWLRGDLGDEGFTLPGELAHIDCYGVLHHMARPAAALARLGGLLAPGGTLRLMVYNSAARGWLRHLQRAFALLGLDPAREADRSGARDLLAALSQASPALRDRLSPMRETLSHPARFVDTFFHAREARLDPAYWLRAVFEAGLEPMGLYDRYGELDDLPNPLLEMPAEGALRERIADRRYEGNLELYLAKPGPERTGGPDRIGPAASVRLPAAHARRPPPEAWRGYRETDALPRHLLRRAWIHFLANVSGRPSRADAWAGSLPPRAFQRLGRLGAVFPDECASAELKALLRAPLEDAMEPPETPAPANLRSDRALRARVERMLRDRMGRDGRGGARAERGERKIELVMARLDAAQRP